MKTAKKIWLILAITMVALALGASGALALTQTLSYSNNVDTNIAFTGTGDTFTFIDPALVGHDIVITGGTPPGNTAIGLFGDIDGTFQIGSPIIVNGPLQTAPVTSIGVTTFSITDAANLTLSGNIAWNDIFTLFVNGGTNVAGAANLTGITYTGANPDLVALRDAGIAEVVMSFTFLPAPGFTLTQLTADGTFHNTSYSGTVSYNPIPVPPSAILLGSGLLGLGLLRRRWSLKK